MLKYFGTTVTNQNFIREEMRRLNFGNDCYHSVQNFCFVSLGKPRCRWVGNIKFNLGKRECGGMGWIDLDLERD
jgi:hypothetical protein